LTALSYEEFLAFVAGSLNEVQNGKLVREITMRIMALVVGSTLMVFAAYSQAAAARYTSNPDRNYYQSAAGSCGGAASCYRSGSLKHQKKH
jgi:hypothetical protein